MEQIYKTKDECSGCSVCAEVCARNAIVMKPDAIGFLYPVIDKEKCIDCGACRTVCHMKNSKLFHPPVSKVFAVQSKDREILKTSQSGGAFAIMAKSILQNGGVVYGAAFAENFRVNHIRINSPDNLKKLQGSKYVQSVTEGIFKQVREDLKKSLVVLFSGTPCQIAGLRTYLKKDYDGLYLVEVVCHGVSSPKLWDEYIGYIAEKHGVISYASFREKKFGWRSCYEFFVTPKGNIRSNIFRKIYHKSILLRPCCYSENEELSLVSCRYAGDKRIADITIGDFWGIELCQSDIYDDDTGISILIANTPKGLQLRDRISDDLIFETHTFEEAAKKNPHFSTGTLMIPSKKVMKAQLQYEKKGFWKFACRYGEAGMIGLFPKGIRYIRHIVNKVKRKK